MNEDRHAGGGGAVEHEVEAELALQPEGRGYIGGAVGRYQQRQLAGEHPAQHLFRQVAGRRRLPPAPSAPAPRIRSAYACAPNSAPRSILTPLGDDVPGDSKFEDTALPRVAASMRAGTTVACSTCGRGS